MITRRALFGVSVGACVAPDRTGAERGAYHLTAAAIDRTAWLGRQIGSLYNMAEKCGISRESEWFKNNLKALRQAAREMP